MAANTTPIFPIAPVSVPTQFVNADGTTAKSIYSPTLTNGARVDKILVTNTDTAAYTLQIFLRKSATNYLLCSVPIPASAGNLSTVPPVDVFAIVSALVASGVFINDAMGNRVLYLDAASSLQAAMTGTITAAKAVNILVLGGEY